MIWRDDDIGAETVLDDLLAVDDVFQVAPFARHTLAVVAAGVDRRPDLVDAIRARGMVPQLHAWTHEDLTASRQAREDLPRAVALLEDCFGARPTVLYPPWNRTDAAVEAAAAAIGLEVSTRKTSLSHFLRAQGDVRYDVVNFHYWHPEDASAVAPALQVHARSLIVKQTDYCPRAAPFDVHLTGRALVGAEVGVDAGAHAEALLRYCDVARLSLVDPWPNPYHFGYCQGRLHTLRSRVAWIPKRSHHAAALFAAESLDFLYFDQEHTLEQVRGDLELWWPALKVGGLLGYRNYAASAPAVVRAVDEFVAARAIRTARETGEIVLFKDPPC